MFGGVLFLRLGVVVEYLLAVEIFHYVLDLSAKIDYPLFLLQR